MREALAFGPPPPQAGHFGMDARSEETTGDDWLTVNVWSPDPGPGAELPVMVWIQGGAYVIGMSGLPEYDGGRLARDGGVVVVTFNYRVGVEGFAQIEGAPDELYELVQSDWLFRMPSLQLAEAQAAAGGSAYVYELTWPAPGMGGVFGACHGLDVPLVFGNLNRGQPAMLIGDAPSAEALAVSAQMLRAWASYAAQGDPGWPAYDTDRRLVQCFDTESAVVVDPEERSRRIWHDHPFPVLPLLGG